MNLLWTACTYVPLLNLSPTVESIRLPGYRAPVWGRWLPPSEVRSGVALGGLGTGFVEIRPDGCIYDTQFVGLGGKAQLPPLRLSVTLGQHPATVLISSQSYPGLPPAPQRYFGHYPAVDIDYGRPTPSSVSVWCRAFAPFVPGSAELSNIPAVCFNVRLKNESDRSVPFSVRLALQDFSETATSFADKETGTAGIVKRTADVSFALAARSRETGIKAASAAGKNEVAYAELSGRLAPGIEKTFPLALAWHTAAETGRDGKQYVPNYNGRYANVRAVANEAASQAAEKDSDIVAWQERVYGEGYPGWLKDALINSLYLLARDTVWYGDGLYLSEQQGKVVDSVGSRLDGGLPLLTFFPDLERQALRRLASRQTDDGEIPGRLGQEGSLGAPAFGPGRTTASAEFALLCRRAVFVTKDHAFGKEIFPAVKRAIQFAMTQDTDSDGLINEPSGTKALASLDRYRHDWLWYGTSAYSAGVGLAALRAGGEMATEAGDVEFAAWCHSRFEMGKRSFEENLWNGHIYRLYTDPDGFRQSETSYLGALSGQVFAWQSDLGDLSEPEHIVAAIKEAERLHAAGREEEFISGISPESKPDESGAPYATSTVPRDVWTYCAAALLSAERNGDPEKRDSILKLAERAYNAMAASGTIWSQHSAYRSGDLAPAGDPHYFGNLSVWMLPQAMGGIRVSK